MKKVMEIVPAPPGWYARWRLTPEDTRAYPVTVWAVVEDDDTRQRSVVGVDAGGQWPGGDDNEPGWDFLRYVYVPVDGGQPDDVFNPVKIPAG